MKDQYTKQFLSAVNKGLFNKDEIITAFCMFLGEDKIKEFIEVNEIDHLFKDSNTNNSKNSNSKRIKA